MEWEAIVDDFLAPVSEMETPETWKDIVKLDRPAVDAMVAELKDDAPEFPVIRVEEGWSRNGRLWTASVMGDIAEQINTNQPVAHLGHIPAAEHGTALPAPQTVWLGATVKVEPSQLAERKGQNVTVLYAKGYNLPDAKIRGYLKAKAVNSTSWDGRAQLRQIPGKGVEVVKFILSSLDWSRKNSQGMSARFLGLAAEMSTIDDNEGGNKVEFDWAKVTVDQIKTENPSLYATLVAEMAKEKDEEIEGLQEQVTAAEADTDLMGKIREALGADADADVLAVIGDLMSRSKEIVKGSLNKHLEKILLTKVPNEASRKAVMSLLPAAEMEAKLPTDKTDEETEAIVLEMVNEAFDKNDVISNLVSEMGGSGHSLSTRRVQLGEGGKGDKQLAGMTSSRKTI